MNVPKTISIDGIEYVRADSVTITPTGNRGVVVLDRGWVFAGDIVREHGRIQLSRAILVQRWEAIGFDGMIENPKSKSVISKPLKKIVDFPEEAELFTIPVESNWGL